ncbi:GNAT family N-acetyltransferase [Actinopolymorpha pittospori]|uniref:Acetyltransferase n=1 Tax=Actinopolymorpha pittospori TaxID=648752 RepID=A0A927RL03_9ACTN|nr:GNAT family N-acetyltransferase [Actinopolymorpha pittospori]MBE1608746.1 putative acetyltransferase [Actinopolymorpha pittospori]
MAIDVRPLGDDAWHQAVPIMELAFGEEWPSDAQEPERGRYEPDRAIGAFTTDEMVGHAAIYSLRMTVPGQRELDVAGVSMVGVLPTHRRRGVLTALMRHQLGGLYESGREAVAVLTASEPAIYGRFGYGLATEWVSVEIQRTARSLRPVAGVDDVTIRYADADKVLDATNAVRESVVAARPGMFHHNESWRRSELADPVSGRHGGSPLRCVVAERAGQVSGFAYFHTRSSWDERGPGGTTTISRVQATDAASSAALWRFLLDQDLMATTGHRRLSLDDPILAWLLDVRRAKVTVRDGMWARLVDVGRALGSRGYAAPVDVVLDVHDEFCPWNAGRWRLVADAEDADSASCVRTEREADLVLDVRDLASAYLGRPTLLGLGAAGLVEERVPGTLARVARAFRNDPLPLLDTPF